MRIFTVRRGLYKGEHIIYDNPGEANAHGIMDIKIPWHHAKVGAGDWVVSDDGYVVQCLRRYPLTNPRHKSGQWTDVFQFPQGLFTVYHGKGNKLTIKNFYAQLSYSNRTSLGSETSSLGKFLTIRKKEFVTLMGLGYDAYSSYVKAFNIKNRNLGYITIQVNRLLSDERVQDALMDALRPFMEKVEKKISTLSKGEYSDIEQLAVDRTADLLLSTPKSIKDKALVLKLTFDLFGKIKGLIDVTEKKNTKEIQEAQFEMVAPPSLKEAT